ncbi:hypothetical protein ABB37_02372 [Leptomonas pyrrhocoris]|uniref:Tyrosine specific protein phosphatases domain-containing protein n=1 Tax=Leptomonas pyrrhocoris TaxID=157538 RepID=A0A0M9G838_LEPPY|nr:hypothetical protein ABB37_02372 [Leptomonas pyrrhocoris]XP_015662826.1 hypothetical protein ABB37_02372 [Leptomonas pyrrhocoris]KPA84386.1 hypothetical protein ABB37_02372 [Leptomonas pyrrhocoris]KPA84387.1 hypothetical protein ABB37_02372 [Leptomonas pyrrhocoris]|eukprot:XP_015662825.1 hypothetical protein ABB37_02372 [Leptomonas pyrrhocoris]
MLSDLQQQRHVELEGTVNLRNLGGYHTKDGTKTTKWGVLYRGDTLGHVPSDVAQRTLVNALHIHNAYDMRNRYEVARQPYHIPNINRYAVPIDTRQLSENVQVGDCLNDTAAVVKAMQDVYRDLVRSHGKAIGKFIKGFLNSKPSPQNATIFHCTAGKDRTGWAAYVILTLLDVEERDKRLDYILTNNYYGCPRDVAEYLRCKGVGKEVTTALWAAFEELVDAGMNEVNKLGGMEAYAKSHMGLTDDDIQQLRDVMLE